MVSTQAKVERSQKLTTRGPARRRRAGDRKAGDCRRTGVRLMPMRILPWISLLALLSCMKAPDPARAMGPPPEKGPPTLVFQVPEGWEEMPSSQSILLASWTLPGEGIGNISWMGNRPEIKQVNLQRWINQFEDRGRSETGALEGLSTHPVTLLEVEGTLAQTRQVGPALGRESSVASPIQEGIVAVLALSGVTSKEDVGVTVPVEVADVDA